MRLKSMLFSFVRSRSAYLWYVLSSNKILLLCLVLVFGIILPHYVVARYISIGMFTFVVVLGLAGALRAKVILLCVVFTLGVFRTTMHLREYELSASQYGETVDIVAKIKTDPYITSGGKQSFEVDSEYGGIILRMERYPRYVQGQVVRLSGVLEEPPVFDDFSYKEFLQTRGVAYVMQDPDIELQDTRNAFFLIALRGDIMALAFWVQILFTILQ